MYRKNWLTLLSSNYSWGADNKDYLRWSARLAGSALLVLLLSACASTPHNPYAPQQLSDKAPLYITTVGNAGYYLGLSVQRSLQRQGVQVTNIYEEARTIVDLAGPTCVRYVVFTDALGQRRDYMLSCRLNYSLKLRTAETTWETRSSLLASSLLIRTNNLSAYYQREEDAMVQINAELTNQLLRVLASVQPPTTVIKQDSAGLGVRRYLPINQLRTSITNTCGPQQFCEQLVPSNSVIRVVQ